MELLKKFGVLKPKSVTDQKSLDHWIKPPKDSEFPHVKPGLSDDPSVDPHWLYLGPNAAYSRYIFERLIDRDENANIVARLAESWENVDDLTWKFNLRKGVKFHDGSDFTADDVIFSIDEKITDTERWSCSTLDEIMSSE